ncbi:unnamed protein product [Phytomonas sp. Hart1]|nr:unnamed protein product [Phytomonas sp. Hart1]|eukprot:CCW70636.1 unnamed protein product [Phytomonas sp. isolate Hart1]
MLTLFRLNDSRKLAYMANQSYHFPILLSTDRKIHRRPLTSPPVLSAKSNLASSPNPLYDLRRVNTIFNFRRKICLSRKLSKCFLPSLQNKESYRQTYYMIIN